MALLFRGHLKEGAQKSNEGAQESKGGAQASNGGAAPRYVALAHSLYACCALHSIAVLRSRGRLYTVLGVPSCAVGLHLCICTLPQRVRFCATPTPYIGNLWHVRVVLYTVHVLCTVCLACVVRHHRHALCPYTTVLRLAYMYYRVSQRALLLLYRTRFQHSLLLVVVG